MHSPVRIGIVAGEASGDQLGAALIPTLKEAFPTVILEGIGGDKMLAEGFTSLYPMESLSVMGLVEPLKRLPELLRIRRGLFRHFNKHHFDLVVGIDSPDFNLGLELKLRKRGVLTAHYVSPSVWAWRQGRVKKIARAVDQMLTLFPFENKFYQRHQIPVAFVGHPLAEDNALNLDQSSARQMLAISDGQWVAVMPGSRASEVALMGPLFLDVVQWLVKQMPKVHFIIPAANQDRFDQLQALIAERPELPVRLINGNSHTVMAAADAVLLTSGTTALEAMLLNKPMVVAYRMGAVSYTLLSRLVKSPFIALPNLIAGKALVPELVQNAATVEVLGPAIMKELTDGNHRQQLRQEFQALQQSLKNEGKPNAAQVLIAMIHKNRGN